MLITETIALLGENLDVDGACLRDISSAETGEVAGACAIGIAGALTGAALGLARVMSTVSVVVASVGLAVSMPCNLLTHRLIKSELDQPHIRSV